MSLTLHWNFIESVEMSDACRARFRWRLKQEHELILSFRFTSTNATLVIHFSKNEFADVSSLLSLFSSSSLSLSHLSCLFFYQFWILSISFFLIFFELSMSILNRRNMLWFFFASKSFQTKFQRRRELSTIVTENLAF